MVQIKGGIFPTCCEPISPPLVEVRGKRPSRAKRDKKAEKPFGLSAFFVCPICLLPPPVRVGRREAQAWRLHVTVSTVRRMTSTAESSAAENVQPRLPA